MEPKMLRDYMNDVDATIEELITGKDGAIEDALALLLRDLSLKLHDVDARMRAQVQTLHRQADDVQEVTVE